MYQSSYFFATRSYSTLIIQHRVAYDYYNNFQNVVPTFLFPLILIEKNAIETLPLFSHPNLDRHSPIFRRPRYILCTCIVRLSLCRAVPKKNHIRPLKKVHQVHLIRLMICVHF